MPLDGVCAESSSQLFIFLALTACLYRASRLAIGESWGPSQFFPENAYSYGHEHSPTYACGLSDFQQCHRAFLKPPLNILFPDFSFKLCSSPIVCLNWYCYLRQSRCWTIFCGYFQQVSLGDKALYTGELWVYKDSLLGKVFQGIARQGMGLNRLLP